MRPIIAFLALGLVLFIGLNRLSQAIPERGDQLATMRAALARVPGRQAVSLGGSVGVDIDFEAMCLDAEHFDWPAQDLFEAAAFADLILDRPTPPGTFLLIAAPTAQTYDNGSPASPFAAHRRTMYRFLWRAGGMRLIGDDWRQAFVAIAAPSLRDDAWRPQLRFLLGLAGVPLRPADVPPTLEEMARRRINPATSEARAVEAVGRRQEQLRRMAYYDPTISERSTQVVLRVNRRIRAAGGRMVVVVPPMTPTLRRVTQRELGPDTRDFERRLDQLEKDGAIVARHWDDPAYEGRYDLFRDNEHLNDVGAAVFSRQLAAELSDQGVLPAARDCPPAPHEGSPVARQGLPHPAKVR